MIYLELDDSEAAYDSLQIALPLNQRAGNHYASLSCMSILAYVSVARGALHQVVANLEQGLLWIGEWSRKDGRRSRSARMLAILRREMGLVQYERNELKQAAENLKKACDYFELAQSWLRLNCWAHLVDLHLALGEVDRALGYYGRLKRFCLRPGLELPTIPVGATLARRSLMLSRTRPDLDHLFAEASEKLQNPDCHYSFPEYRERLVLAAKGSPGPENEARFAQLLRESIDLGIISRRQARETFSRYFDPEFYAVKSESRSSCSSLRNKEDLYAAMRVELGYKREGMLDMLDDEERFRQAQHYYNDLYMVFEAVSAACTQSL